MLSAIERLALASSPIGLAAASISAHQREKWRKQGVSMPDGSFPIPNIDYLRRAIQSFGRAPESSRDAVKAHIKRRAKALGAEQMLPEDWDSESSETSPDKES